MQTTPKDPRAQLAEAISRIDDDQVLGLMQLVGVDAAVEAVFFEMQRRFRPEEAAGKKVVIEWELSTPDASHSYQMTAGEGGLWWQKGATEPPELHISCAVTDFIRLMLGQLDSTEAFMTGRLRLAGDLQLVQEMGAWFNLT